jgi:hypothetical protein
VKYYMAQNVFDTTQNAVFIPTIISQKALGRFPAYMNLAKTVSRDFDWTPATQGQTIQVPKRGALVANDKTSGNVFTLQNPAATNVSVTLNKHKEVTFALDDVTKVVQNQDTQAGYADDAAIALAESVETTLTALYPSVNTVIDLITTTAATIDTSILNIRKYFANQKVPQAEQRYAYVDPSVVNTLLNQDKYSRYDALGNAIVQVQQIQSASGGMPQTVPTQTGRLTRIYGIDFFESQNVAVSGSPVAYHNLVYTRNGFLLASRPLADVPTGYGAMTQVVVNEDIQMGLRAIMHYDADLGAFKLTLDLLFGVAVLDQRRCVIFESF